MKISFAFDVLVYLAQRIPALRDSSNSLPTAIARRSFRWPSEKPHWQVPRDPGVGPGLDVAAPDQEPPNDEFSADPTPEWQRILGRAHPPEIEFDPDQTVLEAIQQLDAWLIPLLREHLPDAVTTVLRRWLSDQWRPYGI